VTVFEPSAILFYLAEKTGSFLPAEVRRRYEVMQWLMIQLTGVGPIFGQLAHFKMFAPAGNYVALASSNNDETSNPHLTATRANLSARCRRTAARPLPLPAGYRIIPCLALVYYRELMSKIRILALGALASGVIAAAGIHATVAESGEVFRGKTVTLYCACGVGSGYDFIARLLARHIGHQLPGNPSVVVSNMPGGLGIPTANYIYNNAPKDGTAIAMPLQNIAEEQILGSESIQYDASKFGWIGRLAPNVEIAYVWHSVPIKAFDDLKQRETIFAANGPSAILYPSLLNITTGTRIKLVRGYGATPVVHLALERGEVEGMTGSLGVIKTLAPEWMQNKTVTILVQYQRERHPQLADIPAVMELMSSESDKELFGFFINSAAIGRSFLAPPGLPEDRLAMLRDAFQRMLDDPEFAAEVTQAKHDILPLPGPELQRIAERQLNASPALLERIRRLGLR
jgi:tripartite-type tricarboxylate transporter receptor subunit TctC